MTLTTPERTDVMTEPQRPRAVFSNEDFRLIRSAIEHYLPIVRDQPDSTKFANLYHRLGRLS
ncbi:hypothetical protein ETR14_10400 [Sphingosinicella sp. BN140058]|nr:hypothetical protein ETR14_10400 [Sphingosinicella sp. BN140058]